MEVYGDNAADYDYILSIHITNGYIFNVTLYHGFMIQLVIVILRCDRDDNSRNDGWSGYVGIGAIGGSLYMQRNYSFRQSHKN